jgi:hypothetical protein
MGRMLIKVFMSRNEIEWTFIWLLFHFDSFNSSWDTVLEFETQGHFLWATLMYIYIYLLYIIEGLPREKARYRQGPCWPHWRKYAVDFAR